MNKQIDLSNIGGFPFEEDTLAFMQDSYTQALAAVAQAFGNKVILYGVEVTGSTVSSGWIAYNGKLIPFLGGDVATNVVVINGVDSATFEDDNVYPVFTTTYCTCALLGDFLFTDLVRISTLQNMAVRGDLKHVYCDDAYVAANFDGAGNGLNERRGWRIFSKQVAAAAGKTLVNQLVGDADFGAFGVVTKGEKAHTQTVNEMPAHEFNNGVADDGDSLWIYGGVAAPGSNLATGNVSNSGGAGNRQGKTNSLGGGQAFNVIQPSFVVLILIKL